MTQSIAIVGAGLAGSVAALVLARAGHRVILIDRHPVYPKEFRVEKLAGVQLELLRRVGVLDLFDSAATHFQDILNVRGGQVVDRTHELHYAMSYEEMVRIWEVEGWRERTPLDWSIGRLTCVAFAPDGMRAACSNTGSRIVIWDWDE